MLKRLVLILGVVVVAWWVFSGVSPKSAGPVSGQQAIGYVTDDVKLITAEKRVLSVEKQGDEWAVELLLSYNAHSACPNLSKRSYRLLPIRYREEALVKDCSPKNLIAYPEEALMTSSAVIPLSKTPGSYGCAFYLGKKDDSYQCDKLDKNAFNSFTQGLPTDAWVVYWTAGEEKSLLAFDRYANILKKS